MICGLTDWKSYIHIYKIFLFRDVYTHYSSDLLRLKMMAGKRGASVAFDEDEASKPLCKWGSLCYRKNPDHLEQFAHPHRTSTAAATLSVDARTTKVVSTKAVHPPAFPPSDGSAKKNHLVSTDAKSQSKPKHSDANFLESCYDMSVRIVILQCLE